VSFKLDALHPAVCVTAGFFLIVLIQYLGGVGLVLVGVSLILLAFVFATQSCMRLVRRMRYIFLALLLLFAWQTPGVLLLPEIGVFSPSKEGVMLACEQLLRLLGAASVVAVLLHLLDTAAWMNGLHVLLRPLEAIGFSTDRFILRLRLVMDYVAERELNWRVVLEELDGEVIERDVEWMPVRLTWIDRFLIAGMGCVFLGVCWWRG